MARSIGEAAALGLESGYRLGMDYQNNQRQVERQRRMDEEAQADRLRTRERQDQADTMGALNAQEQMLAQEPEYTDPLQQQDFVRRQRTLGSAKSAALGKRTGIDLTAVERLGAADIEKIKTGDIAGLKPGQFTRGLAVATGRNPADYVRQAGKPALVEQAAGDFIEGLHGNDEKRMLGGLNVMFARELRTGEGEASPHDGTIVKKEIVDLHEDPRGNKDDPRVIPMLRIYVNNGKEFRGPLPPGVPKGATGYYDAPLTQNRSSDPNDPVRSIGISEAQGYIDNQVKLVELLNSPEGLQKLAEDAKDGDFDPAEYTRARYQVGAQPKVTTKDTTIPAGSSILRTRYGPKGEVLGEERIEGREKPATGSRGALQQKIDAIEAQGPGGTGLLTDTEVEKKKRALIDKEAALRASGGGASGGGGGSGGIRVQSKDVDADGHVYYLTRDGKVQYPLVDGKRVTSQQYAKRIDKLASDLGKSAGGIGKSAAELRKMASDAILSNAKPEKKVLNELPSGAKVIGTSGGKKVYQLPDGSKFKED